MKLLAIKLITRAEYNPRTMPQEEMQSLIRSLKEFGCVEPLVVNVRDGKYILVGGHQRLTAIEHLIYEGSPPKGIECEDNDWKVPVMEVELTDEQEKTLNLALNRIHGTWDDNKLAHVIDSIKESPLIMHSGFSAGEIASILTPKEETPHEDGVDVACHRCQELRDAIAGHQRKSGHIVYPQAS